MYLFAIGNDLINSRLEAYLLWLSTFVIVTVIELLILFKYEFIVNNDTIIDISNIIIINYLISLGFVRESSFQELETFVFTIICLISSLLCTIVINKKQKIKFTSSLTRYAISIVFFIVTAIIYYNLYLYLQQTNPFLNFDTHIDICFLIISVISILIPSVLVILIEVLKQEILGNIINLPIITITLFCPFTISYYIIEGLHFSLL